MATLVDERRGSDDQDDDKEDGEDNGDGPVFSLVTGTYRHPKRYGGGGEDSSSAPISKLKILSEDQQPQIGATSGAQSAVILRNQDSGITQLDRGAGKFPFTRLPSYFTSVCSFTDRKSVV